MKKFGKIILFLFIVFSPVFIRAQEGQQPGDYMDMDTPNAAEFKKSLVKGVVKIYSTEDPSVLYGEVRLSSAPGRGLLFQGILKNVPAAGMHAIHIHENGSCKDGGLAAGGHYNPKEAPHGFYPRDGEEKAHMGDMGNIEVKPNGSAIVMRFMNNVFLEGDVNNVSGLAVILHEKVDDFGQPTGNAGGRIGCGLIEVLPKEDSDNTSTPTAEK